MVKTPAQVESQPRQGSSDSTVLSPEDEASIRRMPEVDMAHAASLKPSKLHGKPLMIMVNLVAGVAFVLFGYDQGEYPPEVYPE